MSRTHNVVAPLQEGHGLVLSMRSDLTAIRARLPDSLSAYVRACVTVDTRSLAVFRMFVAVLIVADLLSRSRNFWFYYTDDGAVSQSLAELYTTTHAVSIFFYTQDARIIAALFALHGLIAILLFIGWKSRLMLVLSFYFVISLDHHNPFVLSYADTLFRMLLFWAIFLPLGERWSVDALQRGRQPRRAVASLATAAIMVQMVFMYFVNGQNKWPSGWWHGGDAAIIVMGIDEMTFLLGDFMRNFPALLHMGGRMWFYLIVASPLLILLYGRARYPMWISLFGGHASFAITVRIGAFPYVAWLGLIAFLQPQFWRDAQRVTAALHLDGTTAWVADRGRRAGDVLADTLPGRLIDFPARDDLVRATLTVLVALAIVGLFVWPAFAFTAEGPYLDESPLPDDGPLDDVVSNWNVNQPEWSIFAGPGPRSGDRWYVIAAETSDGELLDIYNERPMSFERPGQQLQQQHDAYRKRFYMNSIRRGGQGTQVVTEYADVLCEQWEDEHGVEIERMTIYTVRERITLETIDSPEDRERRIDWVADHSCGDAPRQQLAPPEEWTDDYEY